MKRIGSIIFKISKTTVFVIILFCLLLYFSLWIYINNSVPKELKLKYNQNIESCFNDNQYEIILFSFAGHKNNRFKWHPFLFDFIFVIISGKYDNTIASVTASTIAGEYFYDNIGKYTMTDWHIMNYGFTRYVIIKNNYKKCIDIILEKCLLGENIYGIKNASKHYFNKEVSDLSDEELISLIVLSYAPTRFKIGTEENRNRTLKIINEYGLY